MGSASESKVSWTIYTTRVGVLGPSRVPRHSSLGSVLGWLVCLGLLALPGLVGVPLAGLLELLEAVVVQARWT